MLSPTEQYRLEKYSTRRGCSTLKLLDQRLKVAAIHQQSILMRLRGDVTGSELVINEFLLNYGNTVLPVSMLTPLHLSQTMNHIYRFNFNHAHEEMKTVPSPPNAHDNFLWDRTLCVSRAFRGSGDFAAAKTAFQLCLATPGLCKPKRCLVTSALADTLCELAVMEHDNSHLVRAEELVMLAVTLSPFPKGLRRLRLSLLEIKINQGSRDEAEFLIKLLLDTYNNLEKLDIVDRLGHVRTLIAHARIALTPEEEISRWVDVLNWNRFYNPHEEEVFTCGAVYIIICSLFLRLGNWGAGLHYYRKGTNVLARKERQFLIPGLGTYIFHKACVIIGSMGLSLTFD